MMWTKALKYTRMMPESDFHFKCHVMRCLVRHEELVKIWNEGQLIRLTKKS